MGNPFKLNVHSANGHSCTVDADPIPVRSAKRLTKGTEQQEALWAELSSPSKSGVVVEARAGCGKSTSCREAMWRRLERRPDTKIRYTCFNSVNAREFGADAPPGVDVGTMHSFGLKALSKALGSKIEKNKSYLILDETREGRQLPKYMRHSVTSLVSLAKDYNLDPGSERDALKDHLTRLARHHDVEPWGRMRVLVDFTVEVLERALEWTELVDFGDMLWLPARHKISLGECDILFIDEAQDLNKVQMDLIDLACPTGRVVIVGDRYQAIYAFRGADCDSIPNLRAKLAARKTGVAVLPLTVTWRCPRSHVELARQFVPDIEAHPSAIDGDITSVKLDAAKFEPGSMVLCPANAPLITSALRLIAAGRRAIVRGRKVGTDLLAVLSKCGQGFRTTGAMAKAVAEWESRELARLADLDGMDDVVEQTQDRAAGLQAVIAGCQSPEEVPDRVRDLFADDASPSGDAVVFSTIHRAKGLEAESVYLLEVPMREAEHEWERQQQANLRYVGLTRSKRSLTFVEMPKQ